MHLRTRLILALSYLALLGFSSSGLGRPWMRMLASGLLLGSILIYMSERRIRSGTGEHTTLNIQR